VTYAFKYLLKDSYRLLRSAAGRRLLGLMARYADAPRYQPRRVEADGLTLDVPDALSFVWQYKEIFVDEFYRFATTEAAPVIFDCGANVGTSALFFKKTYPNARVVAFEADAAIADFFERNLTQNGVTGVELVRKAVWTDDGGVDFGRDGADGASIFAQTPKTRVPSVRLRDRLLAEERIELLKIDIEGAEAFVLPDCRGALGHVQNMFVEYHAYPDQPQNLGEILEILRESGFRYYLNSAVDRPSPLVNRRYRGNDAMDVQLNVFGYRT
jgi:FkbM family methyltransferase